MTLRSSLAPVLVVLVVAMSVGSASAAPALPATRVDTTYPEQPGRTVFVVGGGDLQAALNDAQLGDTILLEPNATFTGPFILPAKSGSGWIVIRTSATLPPEGTGVKPSDASLMPKLEAPSGTVVNTAPGAHHYRFVGVEIRPASGKFLYNLVLLGNGERSVDQLPHHIIFDRCYLHGDPQAGTRRGIAMNGTHQAVIDSYLADFKEAGADSQAIAGWAGPGPFKIVNNYLEGAGENVMFGGADPVIRDVVPSDIEIRGNHVAKPLTWRIGDPAYAGTAWTVKNLLELKNARRVLIEGNLFEYVWAHAQSGTAIVFTGRNQSGTAPWSVVEDVTFTNNVIRHTGGGLVILGLDDNFPNQLSKRFLIRNNVFDDISWVNWGGDGRLFSIFRGPADVVIEHNTGFPDRVIIMAAGEPALNFVFRNNIVGYGLYGIAGDNVGMGLAAINYYLPGSEIRRNVFINTAGVSSYYPPDNYPPDTLFVTAIDDVRFLDAQNGDYELALTSPYKGAATDGADIGIDVDPGEPAPDTQAPSIRLVAPTKKATVYGSVLVTASAADSVGVTKIEFKVDGILIATAMPPTQSFTWDTSGAAPGAHVITATALDAAGNHGSTSMNVTVARSVTVSIISPKSGQGTKNPLRVKVRATSLAGQLKGIAVSIDGKAPTWVPCSTRRCAQTMTITGLTVGQHAVSATATDGLGNTGSAAPVIFRTMK